MEKPISYSQLFRLPVIVAALGYFVDIYDLLLFGIVRIPSLKSLGLTDPKAISSIGTQILNWQMFGLLLGGILWGVLGDKKGRLSVLFGSILTYSLANVACGFVQDPSVYMVLRFVAGIGLAGELGAGITLVSEVLPKELRAIGTSLVAGIGLLGAVVAYFTVELFDWRTAYFMGGGLGLGLLLLRVGVIESGMFKGISDQKHIRRGDFFSLFTNGERLGKYLRCIGLGLPTWFAIGILLTFSNEIAQALSIPDEIKPGRAIMFGYIGLSIGDLLSGFISHWLHSRRKAVGLMSSLTVIFSTYLLYGGVTSASTVYLMSGLLGFSIGYWAMFVTIGAEQFGTNLRATVATTVPNMVRGATVLMTSSYQAMKPSLGVLNAAATVGILCFCLAFYSIFSIDETHGRDLDFLE
ncbi:MAG: MFS transporter [Spirosomataceae bacterium]